MNTVIVNGVNITEEHEKLKTSYEALVKDVARYFELRNKANMFFMEHTDELRELWALEEKLSKVGKEE